MADVGATEHQLSELLSNGTDSTGTYDLIVKSCNILDYSPWYVDDRTPLFHVVLK